MRIRVQKMRKAYDTILQSEVSAKLAAQNDGFEPYRYECSNCGEEVYVAAPNSTRMVAHFRHRSGNNDVECENYLGQHGTISTDSSSRRNNRERAEFYYNNSTKTFSLALRFSENEIQSFEQQSVSLELRTKDSDMPFRILQINSMNFSPDVPTLIPLSNFSVSYYLSNTLNGVNRKYDFLKRGNTPTFFKLSGNDNDFKAKLVRSPVLYTKTQYFVALHSQYSAPQGVRLPEGIEVGQTLICKRAMTILSLSVRQNAGQDESDSVMHSEMLVPFSAMTCIEGLGYFRPAQLIAMGAARSDHGGGAACAYEGSQPLSAG